ncbi:MAG: FHA domain-containing protein [Planctomycetota bacterium]|nr:FHA domain-containing protein [Planctomycetota bacterium]
MIELKPETRGYNDRKYLKLRGTGSLGDGENLKLSLGETVVCGRSRHCDWSLKRTPKYLMADDGEREQIKQSVEFRSVSRQHVRIAFLAPDMVDIENLSSNGTYVDGNRVDRIVLKDCETREHAIQLGPKGVILHLEPGSLPLPD